MVGSAATLASSAAILKTKYNQPKVYWLAYKNNPAFATVRKATDFDGNNKVIAVQTEVPQGGGSSVGQAQTNMNPGVYKNFLITRIEDFGVARVKGQALRAAQKNAGALVDLWTREMDGIMHHVTRSAAIHMWRSGTGSRGQISAASNVATATITLTNIWDVTNFAVGLLVQATATDGGTAPRSAGATASITGIDRVLGTLTVAVAWSTSIAAVAASDYLVRAGDYVGAVTASTNTMVTGVQGWNPASNPASTAFFGLDRTSDYTRLSGCRLDGTGVPMQEILLESLAMLGVEGAEPDKIWMHPRDRAQLVKELGAKVTYQRVETKIPGSQAKVGFKGVEFETDSGTALIMSDLNVPRQKAFPTQWDTWALESLGPAPQILNWDSNEFLRVTDDDSYEVRVGYYAQLSNAAPAFTCHVYNFGQ